MAYAIELLNEDGNLHCGFWNYPVHAKPDGLRRGRDVPRSKPASADLLAFESRADAHVALEFYRRVSGDSHIDAQVKEVDVEATHQLSDDGFEPLPQENSLFA